MPQDLKNTALPRALAAVIGDLVDLIQKELRLARAEFSEKLGSKIRAGLWLSVAGALAFVALLAVVEALIFGLAARFNLAIHWSCLLVAGALAASAALAFVIGREKAKADLTPERTIYQFKQDIAAAKEQL